jgi:hypothetical protein
LTKALLLAVVSFQMLAADDASHLLVPPPPIAGEVQMESDNPEASALPTDKSVEQMEQERQKREKLEQGTPPDEEEQEKGLDQLMKNPKFRLNIPF